jgi:hypothetical protein
MFWCPVILFLILIVLPLVPIFAPTVYFLGQTYSSIRTAIKNAKWLKLFGVFVEVLFAMHLAFGCSRPGPGTPVPPTQPPAPTNPTAGAASPTNTMTPTPSPKPTNTPRSLSILVDDFSPQPYQGETVYFFNRLGGDRGEINNPETDWGTGQVTTTVSSGNSYSGIWESLSHPIREGLPIDFSAVLPPQILPAYQSRITGMTAVIAGGTPGRTFKLELKDRDEELHWKKEIVLHGGRQVVSSDLPALGNINQLVWVLDDASAGDYVVLENVAFTVTTQITDTATAAFVWSYGMLLNNWNPTTGLVRDKAKDASGEFDAIQATGSLAAATAVAEQLGIVRHRDAVQIVGRISDTLLLDLPRYHGLWPHWVKVSPGDELVIVENTEWSSVDTVIAAIGLLAAQSALGMDPSGTEQMLQDIDWDGLVTPGGISHGYTYTGDLIPYAWDVFGGESWLVQLAYAGATGQVAPMAFPWPPTANGSGFIDELAWLFAPPPSGQDHWGTDWGAYRSAAADRQISYYPINYPEACLSQIGLFGLSAAEVPDPSSVPQASIYQACGVGGRFASPNDGSALLGAPVVVPHYAAMMASLRPNEAIEMWDWLTDNGYFSPLTNVESLIFPASSGCDSAEPIWNQLKGSWNLSLQTLGWGRYLAERDGQVPILWQATTANPLFSKGYLLLAPSGSTTPIAIYVPQPSETPVTPIWNNTQIACDEKPLYMWSSPGIYLYKKTTKSGGSHYFNVEQNSRKEGPDEGKCGMPWPDFGNRLTGPPETGHQTVQQYNFCDYDRSRPPGSISIAVVGGGNRTVGSETYRAVRVDTLQEYHFPYPKFVNDPQGSLTTSEWYVCGYGLIHSKTSHTGKYQGRDFQSKYGLELISFTPISTNESHVRYIIADIELGNLADNYRVNIRNEETAEALRRWDAGIRIENIEEFERKIVNGQWQIVYAGTENPVIGTDIIQTSDLQQ